MAGDEGRQHESHEQEEADGIVESDDTTMADAGLTGGTGAQPGEGTVQPYGTEDDDEDGDGEQVRSDEG